MDRESETSTREVGDFGGGGFADGGRFAQHRPPIHKESETGELYDYASHGFELETQKPRTFSGKILDVAHTYVLKPHNGDGSLRENVEHKIIGTNGHAAHEPIPRYVTEMADLFEWAGENDIPMVVLAGLTGNGVIDVPPAQKNRVQAFMMPTIDDPVRLRTIAHIEWNGLEPVSIDVPASATIQAINAFIFEEFRARWEQRKGEPYNENKGQPYRVAFDITTDEASQIGANFITGALGDSREALHVLEALAVDGNGTIRRIANPQELDAYRGTQGLAGTVAQLRLKIENVPPRREYVLVPLIGRTAETAYTNYPDILSKLFEFMHKRGKGVWIDGADILDRSGLQRIIEVEDKRGTETELKKMAEAKLKEWGDEVHGIVMLNVRHDGADTLENLAGQEIDAETAVGSFLLKLLNLAPENGKAAAQFCMINDPERIKKLRNLRNGVPERGREEAAEHDAAGKRMNASESVDMDVVAEIIEELDGHSSIDLVRENLRRACQAALAPSIEAFMKATRSKIKLRVFLNGHLLMVAREEREERDIDPYFDGGLNIHLRLTGEQGVAEGTIETLITELKEQLLALHGKTFGDCVRLRVHEGEKHYLTDRLGLKHGNETAPELLAARRRLIEERGGSTLGWRYTEDIQTAMAA